MINGEGSSVNARRKDASRVNCKDTTIPKMEGNTVKIKQEQTKSIPDLVPQVRRTLPDAKRLALREVLSQSQYRANTTSHHFPNFCGVKTSTVKLRSQRSKSTI